MPEPESDLRSLARLIRDIPVVMMTTFSDSSAGQICHSRPMYAQRIDPETFDGELVFLTDTEAGKVREITSENRVLLTFTDQAGNRFVAILGRASVERNSTRVREYWSFALKALWPSGPDDPSIAIIRVRVDSAEYWDGPPNSLFKHSVLKSLVPGKSMADPVRRADSGPRNRGTLII